MSEDKIKAYIANKVCDLVENFFKTKIEVFDFQRVGSSGEYRWGIAGSHLGLCKIGFNFLETSNRLCFYMCDWHDVHTDCFVWEYPNRLVDVFSQSHPRMIPGSLMIELWKYFDWEMTEGNIQSEYKRFLSSIHRNEQTKIEINARYGLESIALDEETKRANILNGLSEALRMPITSCQSWNTYPGLQDDINCILNGPKKYNKEENNMIIPGIKNVFFNDRTSVIVKCTDNDHFDPEMGLAMAIARRYFGSRTKLKKAVDKWVKTSAPKNEQLKKKAARKAEKEAAKVEHFKAQSESYME